MTDQEVIKERETAFSSLLEWLYRNGLRHFWTKAVDKRISISAYSLCGQLIIIQELKNPPSNARSWEFLMPMTEAPDFDGVKLAFCEYIAAHGCEVQH